MLAKRRVLVFDAQQRSALAVTRALGVLAGTFMITADESERALSASSKYSDLYLKYPSPVNSPADFIRWLASVIEDQKIDLLMPMTEVTSQLILMNSQELPDVALPFSNYQQLMAVADKANLLELADSSGVRVPVSKVFLSAQELDTKDLDYPCVLKPALSYIYEDKRWIGTQVRILKDECALRDALKQDAYLENHTFIIQEFISGYGAGVFCYYDHGEARAYFSHKRIREKPPSGGVSVLSESVSVPEEMQNYADAILSKQGWHGVAMVEFRISEEGVAYLMEVNTRFWGSLQLAVDAGVNFPLWVYLTEMGQSQPESKDYKRGIRLRWLLGDLDGLYIYLKTSDYTIVQKIKRIATFFFGNPFHCKHEVNRFHDLKPALFELKKYLRELVGGH